MMGLLSYINFKLFQFNLKLADQRGLFIHPSPVSLSIITSSLTAITAPHTSELCPFLLFLQGLHWQSTTLDHTDIF